jgi:type II secretory pathway pseudopilin PulG
MNSGRQPCPQAGYTYVALLLAVALMGLVLSAAAAVWSQSREREREQELLFAGGQFRQAIGLYYQGTPGPAKRYPETLEDLLADKRYPMTHRYLRKIYVDPVTGKPEWGLIAAPGGGIMGVYSLSNAAPIKKAEFGQENRTFHGATTYYEWRFFYEPPPAKAPVVLSLRPMETSVSRASASPQKTAAPTVRPR